MIEAIAIWALTYALHSSVLLSLTLLLERVRVLRSREVLESAWRIALFGGLLTATLQLALSSGFGSAEPALASTPPAEAPLLAPAVGADITLLRRDSPALLPASGVVSERGVGRAASDTTDASPTIASAALIVLPSKLPLLPLAIVLASMVLLGLVATAYSWWRASTLARHLVPCTHGATLTQVRRHAELARVRMPAVLMLKGGGSPLVLPGACLCLPAWTLDELQSGQRDAMLAHEIAHIRRRDAWWRFAVAVMCNAMLWQPLNRLARRRLDALAELACDAWAADCASGRALAECLTLCAERVHRSVPRFATAMATRQSPLIDRIQSLLEKPAMRNPLRIHSARLLLGAALPVMLFLPGVAIEAASAGSNSSIEMESSWFGSHTAVSIENDEGSLKARIDGKIEFNDAEDDVSSLSDEAYIEQTVGGIKRRIEFSDSNEGVARKYLVAGKEQTLDADGRRWLATVIPMLLREAAINVEERVARIEARGGTDAVLDEVELCSSDYARRSYIVALSGITALAGGDLDRALALSAKIDSDYERREALLGLLAHAQWQPAQQQALLQAVAGMTSDYEQRVVLTEVAKSLRNDGAAIAAWVAAVDAIKSDYEARVAITSLAERDDLNAELVLAAVGATTGIDSDYEARVALTELAPRVASVSGAAQAYANASKQIGSDYERREALKGLVDAVPLDADGYRAVLDAAEGISSDYECRVTLEAIAEHMPADSDLISRYRAIARKLGSYERGEAEQALDRFES